MLTQTCFQRRFFKMWWVWVQDIYTILRVDVLGDLLTKSANPHRFRFKILTSLNVIYWFFNTYYNILKLDSTVSLKLGEFTIKLKSKLGELGLTTKMRILRLKISSKSTYCKPIFKILEVIPNSSSHSMTDRKPVYNRFVLVSHFKRFRTSRPL